MGELSFFFKKKNLGLHRWFDASAWWMILEDGFTRRRVAGWGTFSCYCVRTCECDTFHASVRLFSLFVFFIFLFHSFLFFLPPFLSFLFSIFLTHPLLPSIFLYFTYFFLPPLYRVLVLKYCGRRFDTCGEPWSFPSWSKDIRNEFLIP